LRSNSLGAFPDPGQSEVSCTPAFLQYVRSNACSIVTDTNPKQAIIVANFRFDSMGTRVPESIKEQFPSHSVNILAEIGRQGSLLSLDDNAESRRIALRTMQCFQFLPVRSK
jgi:hypothetical protein